MHESPFRAVHDIRFFYQGPPQEEALARMHFLVEHRRRLGLLMGASGTGKSLLLEVFAEQMRRTGRAIVKLDVVGLSSPEFLAQLGRSLAIREPQNHSTAAWWLLLKDRISEYRYQQQDLVLLVDSADRATREILPWLLRLVNIDWTPQTRLTLVLTGEKSRMHCLGRCLLELVELWVDLERWEATDTEGFLRAAVAACGRREEVFSSAAIQRLHELAGGLPRRVRQLADLSLVAGAAERLQQIPCEVVEAVHLELSAGAATLCPTCA